jgi:hypothetical protein
LRCFGGFEFSANGHHGEAAEDRVIRRFAVDENRAELREERIEIVGLVGFLTVADLAALGALGPAELDLAQPDEDIGFTLLGGFPNVGEEDGPAFGAGALQFDLVNLDHQRNGHFQDGGDVVIIQAQTGVLHDGFEFDVGDGFQVGLGGFYCERPGLCGGTRLFGDILRNLVFSARFSSARSIGSKCG